jgi:uncharacterized membrane protein
MIYDVITGLSILITLAMTAAVFWFIFAVGVPLRQWLRRELARGTSG